MTNKVFEQFKNAVDEEITEYEAIEELYRLKQAVLVQGKSDALWDVDAKIVDRINKIKTITSKRREAASYLGSENLTMSEVIEKAEASKDLIAEKLLNQKIKLNVLSNSISLYEKTNMELIKHGLTMAGKTFSIIVNALMPQANEYDNSGKTLSNDKMQISSVVEEA